MSESGLQGDLSALHSQTSGPKGVLVTGSWKLLQLLQKSLTGSVFKYLNPLPLS